MLLVIKAAMKREDVGVIQKVLYFYFQHKLINHPVRLDNAFRHFLQRIQTLSLLINCLEHHTKLALPKILSQSEVINAQPPVSKYIFWNGKCRRREYW